MLRNPDIIRPFRDIDTINRFANHPDIRPHIARESDGVLDLTPQISNGMNVPLFGAHGGLLFLYLDPGTYEVHSLAVKEGRGAWFNAASEAAAHWMYTATDAVDIVTRVPYGNVAARAAAKRMGMRYDFTRPKGTIFHERLVDFDVYTETLADWIATAPGLAEIGQWFHDRLDEEAKRLGIEDEPHAPDDAHNRYVGAAALMARNGLTVKAVRTYNRWAKVCRHNVIDLVSVNPPAVRSDIGTITFRGDDIEVLPR
jgi:hypothetical protein